MKLFSAKQLTSLLLAAILIATVSCGASGDTTDTTADTTAAESSTDAPEYVIEKMDLGGEEFVIFGVEPHSNDWTVNTYSEGAVEEENGDLINDAIFRRNLEIEEAFNIKITSRGVTRENVGTEALKVIMSGDDVYDIINVVGGNLNKLLGEKGTLVDLYTVDTIDFTHSWWDQNSIEDMQLGDDLYCVVGDMNFRSTFSPICYVFNQKMVKDYNLDNPFDLVESGKWTLDAAMEMCKAVSNDVNNDGKLWLEDTVGWYGEPLSVFWGYNAMGGMICTPNKDHLPELTLNNEKAIAAVEYYVPLMREGELSIFPSDLSKVFAGENVFRNRMLPMLEQNQLLFFNSTLVACMDLRNMQADFGIVPMPKLDEAQKEYYCSTHPMYVSFMTIPVTNGDLENTGKIVEAMNFLSQKYIVPAIYEMTLTDKVMRDEKSVEMMDLILDSLVFDMGYYFNFGDVAKMMERFGYDNNTNFASKYAGSEAKIQAAIDDFGALVK